MKCCSIILNGCFFDLGYTLINEDEAHIKRINDCIEYQYACKENL